MVKVDAFTFQPNSRQGDGGRSMGVMVAGPVGMLQRNFDSISVSTMSSGVIEQLGVRAGYLGEGIEFPTNFFLIKSRCSRFLSPLSFTLFL